MASAAPGEIQRPHDEFPHFADGDVLLILSPTRQYHLDSLTLRRQSDFFRGWLTETYAAPLTRKSVKEGARFRWRFELALHEDEDGELDGTLQMNPLDSAARPTRRLYSAPGLENAVDTPDIYRHYDNLIRAYYLRRVFFNESDIFAAANDILGLVGVAEELGSVRCIRLWAEQALIKQGQFLYRSVSANPVSWADLACRLKSEILFVEVSVHLIGNWNRLSASKDTKFLPKAVYDLISTKAAELHVRKETVNMQVMGFYPKDLKKAENATASGSHTMRGQGKVCRATAYGTDIFAWMALNTFRHWTGQKLIKTGGHAAADGGFALYKLFCDPTSYVNKEATEEFCQYFPFSNKARNAYETHLGKIKEGVKVIVQPLMVNKSGLDVRQWPTSYLTCMQIDPEEVPWIDDSDIQEERRETGMATMNRLDEGKGKIHRKRRRCSTSIEPEKEEPDTGDEPVESKEASDSALFLPMEDHPAVKHKKSGISTSSGTGSKREGARR